MDSAILTSEALKLPAFERAQMIEALWRSLEASEQSAIDRAWISEARDRIKAFKDGELIPIDGERVFEEVQAALRK